MSLEPEDLDQLDQLILDEFVDGRDAGEPWGRCTAAQIRRSLEEKDKLEDVGNPVRQTIHNRVQRLALASHLENIHDTGLYQLTDDPRE